MEAIRTKKAPAAVGPYSQAIVARAERLIFTAGQIGIDPNTGDGPSGDIEAQTRRVLANLQEVLAAAGSDWAHVVKTTIFLKNMDDFAVVNAVYGEVVGAPPPARSTVEVSRLPKGALIEIEVVAVPAR